MAQYRIQWWALVSTARTLRFHRRPGISLAKQQLAPEDIC